MKIAVLKERKEHELRVAMSPDAVKKLVQAKHAIHIESGAGLASSVSDEQFVKAGATIESSRDFLKSVDILLCVNLPDTKTLSELKTGAIVIGQIAPYENKTVITDAAQKGLTLFAMEWVPRISRAQAMDVLSSQSNLAGYRAVIDGVAALNKATPMMMTAAGTVAPAKVMVLGAGVAGLQAIATAKRLGAAVCAFDVRPAVKEQVESLGAKFIEVKSEESGEASGGYAKEMSEEYKQRQSSLIHETLKSQDIAITTALIPGKPAPVLITEAMVRDMKPGSVIVDLAVASGGNCPLSEPDKITVKHGVTLIGHTNMPSRVATDASPLYARNLYNFLALLVDKEQNLHIPLEDEIIKGTLLTHQGKVVHAHLQ
jgi:NAD(P) transhydrogenase subunit alpha